MFKPIIRRFWRKKSFSLLNILGLSAGIAASLLILLVIRYETGFDGFHKKNNRIYRVVTSLKTSNGETGYNGCVPLPLASAIRRDFPQFEQVAAVWSVGKTQFVIPGSKDFPDKKFKEGSGSFYVEPALFSIFDFPWLAGNPAQALKDPNSVALTQSVANRWFGSWIEAMGKTVLMGDIKTPFIVKGVLQDPPANTDIPLRIVLSYASFLRLTDKPQTDWGFFNSKAECFVLRGKLQDIASAESQLPSFESKYFNDATGFSGIKTTVTFQPLKKIHFDDRYEMYGKRIVSANECWALGLIGIFLILIACINFVNMSTAESLSRSKEVGVRKVLGGNRVQLLVQFLREVAFLVLISMLCACVMGSLVLPFLNNLLDEKLILDFADPVILLYLLGLWLVVSFLAGFYPGILLSSLTPVTAIRNKRGFPKSGNIYLRRGLVILQFTIAQILLVGTVVVVKQVNYFRSRPMGFDTKAIAMVDIPGNSENRNKLTALKTSILKVPGVELASLCSDPPAKEGSWDLGFTFGPDPNFQPFNLISRYADTDYLSTFHMKLLVGRYPWASDTLKELIVNEATVSSLGLKSARNILNKYIGFGNAEKYPVVGVLANFNSKPLREQISPMMISPALDQYQKLAVRMDPQKISATMARVQAAFAAIFPDHVFDYTFFDDSIVDFYRSEAITATIFKTFAALAILISCLGLYGLVSLMTVQKIKEVGIRKVLGASISSIVYLFSREFTWLIGISFVIATPLALYFMRQWLSGFYYRIPMDWGVFAIGFFSSVLIAWASVGYKAVKAAVSNPVDSLRAE